MRTRITNDQFLNLKLRRTDDFEPNEKVTVVSKCSSVQNVDNSQCYFTDMTVVSKSENTIILIDDHGLELAVTLNRGLSEWKFSKTNQYETFIVKTN